MTSPEPLRPLSQLDQARLLEALEEALIATDPQGMIVYWNIAAERLYGYGRDEAVGKPVLNVTVPLVTHEQAREIMALVSSGQSWHGEFEVKRKDGSSFVADVTNVPILGRDGDLELILGLSRDISQRKVLEQERERVLLETQALNRAKDEFLALVSHELRTPVTTVLGFAELLTRTHDTLNPEIIFESLIDIRDAARRMKRLVDDLLTLSRSDVMSAQWQAEIEPVSLERTLMGVVQEHRRNYSGRRLSLEFDGQIPPVLAHQLYLEHVILNLLSNAQKYTPETEIIEITAMHQGTEAIVSVLDRGSGIAESERERIFEPFYRSPQTNHLPGAGLGLAVCRRLMDVQGGSIWVEPRPGGGSTFRLSIPTIS